MCVMWECLHLCEAQAMTRKTRRIKASSKASIDASTTICFLSRTHKLGQNNMNTDLKLNSQFMAATLMVM